MREKKSANPNRINPEKWSTPRLPKKKSLGGRKNKATKVGGAPEKSAQLVEGEVRVMLITFMCTYVLLLDTRTNRQKGGALRLQGIFHFFFVMWKK